MKKRIAALLALCLTLGCLTACGGGSSTSGADASSGSGALSSGSSASETPEVVPPEPVGEAVLPEELPQNFAFSDGSGMWANYLAINRDGSFVSAYTDVVPEEAGEGYPNGTVYYCDYEDMFRDVRQVNSYTWAMTLEAEEGEMEFGETDVKDGVCYVFTEPYGLMGGSYFVLYGPDAPLAELDEELLAWYSAIGGLAAEQTTLGCWAIYNEAMGYTFFSMMEG